MITVADISMIPKTNADTLHLQTERIEEKQKNFQAKLDQESDKLRDSYVNHLHKVSAGDVLWFSIVGSITQPPPPEMHPADMINPDAVSNSLRRIQQVTGVTAIRPSSLDDSDSEQDNNNRDKDKNKH